MSAEEAKKFGLVDDYGDEKDIKASIEGDELLVNDVKINVKNFKNFPKERFQNVQNTIKTAQKQPENAVIPLNYGNFEAQIQINNNFT